MNLEPCISPGDTLFTLHVPIQSDLHVSTWYTKVEQMYEHIAYELRFKFNKAWLNMYESTIYLITLIELFVHINRE